jgi:hypothetical protein
LLQEYAQENDPLAPVSDGGAKSAHGVRFAESFKSPRLI